MEASLSSSSDSRSKSSRNGSEQQSERSSRQRSPPTSNGRSKELGRRSSDISDPTSRQSSGGKSREPSTPQSGSCSGDQSNPRFIESSGGQEKESSKDQPVRQDRKRPRQPSEKPSTSRSGSQASSTSRAGGTRPSHHAHVAESAMESSTPQLACNGSTSSPRGLTAHPDSHPPFDVRRRNVMTIRESRYPPGISPVIPSPPVPMPAQPSARPTQLRRVQGLYPELSQRETGRRLRTPLSRPMYDDSRVLEIVPTAWSPVSESSTVPSEASAPSSPERSPEMPRKRRVEREIWMDHKISVRHIPHAFHHGLFHYTAAMPQGWHIDTKALEGTFLRGQAGSSKFRAIFVPTLADQNMKSKLNCVRLPASLLPPVIGDIAS